ncbi:uncharacterized protein LOC142644038 [Castanea sativa]|uniref:uncharacterized protein LOC142644038 n=1 Tax=Castanea sativa TaxID=21020 RepID=UPI003F650358
MKEFVAEITSMGCLRHRNLVQLHGWCRRQDKLLLVYDYVPNGSLDKLLFDSEEQRKILTWKQRYKILIGVAQALLYLHEESEQRVVHRDDKPSNVLLDANLNARLGDFGLARAYKHGINPHTTHIVGTLGYIAPEFTRTGKATTSTNVYSYVILLLEVACGRAVEPILDDCDPDEVELVLVLGLLSSLRHPDNRRSMRRILQILLGDASLPPLPSDIHLEESRVMEFSNDSDPSSYRMTSSLSSSFTSFDKVVAVSPHAPDCIGAIYGTHIQVVVGDNKKDPYYNRKGVTSFNVMAACDFDLLFTFVMAGWEGAAHDTRIFLYAIHRQSVNFPKPPPGSVGSEIDFVHNGFLQANLSLDGASYVRSNGLLVITNDSPKVLGHATYPSPLQFKQTKNNNKSTVLTFSTNFVFSIVPKYPDLGGHGPAFVLMSTKELNDCLSTQFLGLPYNNTTNQFSTPTLAVEFDTVQRSDFQDINDNHVGIDISSLVSNISKPAAYYNSTSINDRNTIFLKSGHPIQVWIDYNSQEMLINLSISPLGMPMADRPLISYPVDLSLVIDDYMYVGFSAATGAISATHYVHGWSFRIGGRAP